MASDRDAPTELDPERKRCEFDNFFHQTPMELLEEPYNIYLRGIAVPLHGYEDFHRIGLKRLPLKIGGEEISEVWCSKLSKAFFSDSSRRNLYS